MLLEGVKPDFHIFTGNLRSNISKAIMELEKKDIKRSYWQYIKYSHNNIFRDIRHNMRVLII